MTSTSARVAAATPMIWINGRRLAEHDAGISPLDRGFTLADGLFETMRAYDGVVFRARQHLARLRDGARRLEIALPGDLDRALFAAMGAARDAGLGSARIRLTVSRGVGASGIAPSPDAEPTVVLTIAPLAPVPPSLYANGITARLATGRRNERAMTAGLKTLAYADNIAALAQARRAGADDALFLDTEGHLCEAASSNLFVCMNGMIATPAASCGALPGITRAAVIELARAAGDIVQERVVGADELAGADEAFLTSSVRELVPLVRVNGTPVGSGAPGPITRRLHSAYAQLVETERAADH
jgi:branched-chain amino acid aminotransferase